MSELLSAIGLVLAIEGTLYAIMPQTMRELMRSVLATSPDALRLGGVAALAIGVGLVWLVRSA